MDYKYNRLLSQNDVDSELNADSDNPIQNKVVYNEIKAVQNNLTKEIMCYYADVKQLSVEHSMELRFVTATAGDVLLKSYITYSRAVKVKFILDGEIVKEVTTTSGSIPYLASCNGVPAGLHIFRYEITGTSYNLTHSKLMASGNIIVSDDDVFAEGFSSGNGYILNNLGKLEIYSYSANTSTLLNSLYEIKSAKTVTCGDDYIIALTESGNVSLISNVYSTDGSLVYTDICANAKAISATSIADDSIDIFVALDGNIDIYRYTISTGILTKLNSIIYNCEDVSVLGYENKYYLVSVESGEIYISEIQGLSDTESSDIDISNSKTYIDKGVNPTISASGSIVSINYTKNGGANLAEVSVENGIGAVELKGQQAYCRQIAKLTDTQNIYVYGYDVIIK